MRCSAKAVHRWSGVQCFEQIPGPRVCSAPLRAALRPGNAATESPRRTMLPVRELVTLLTPPSAYYRRRIAAEARAGEPGRGGVDKLMRRGGTAVDVGANQGFFAYALSELADRVVAFEPNPDYALFARVMLRGRAEVHRLALADKPGRAAFRVPIDHD